MIRKATTQDVSRIAEIIVTGKRATYQAIFEDDVYLFNTLQVLTIAQEYLQQPELLNRMFVYDDGIIKGMMRLELDKDKKTLEIVELYTEPFYKSKGIGRLMLDYVFEIAKSLQLDTIYLWVIQENTRAISFYQRYGFSTTGEEQLIPGTTKKEIKFRN